MRKTEFYSNGKLLITGEYLVLDGAKSLALPTKFGQTLSVEITKTPAVISWKSFDINGDCWFETEINFNSIIDFENESQSESIENILLRILNEGFRLNPKFLENTSIGYNVSTKLTFPRNWGLGTSSTLINNIAQWLEVDAFELLNKSFGGSGYDIACAQNDTAITYELQNGMPIIEPIQFHPKFKDCIYFVYLNQKQSSKSAIENYRNKKLHLQSEIIEISGITKSVLQDDLSLEDFCNELIRHEAILSQILKTPTMQQTYFKDFEGVIKSLGAWGGDFVMVVSEKNPKAYFKEKGFETILSFDEMILK
jgi:mevalonate kinase